MADYRLQYCSQLQTGCLCTQSDVCKFLVLCSNVIMLWLADVSMKAESVDASECDIPLAGSVGVYLPLIRN